MLRKDQRVVPLYYQVQHTLTARIRSGEYPPGSQLPSESELSRTLSVSRVTVREALRALTDEKLVVKSQGKGTFVANRLPHSAGERTFAGDFDEGNDELPRVRVRHVEIAQVPSTEEIRRVLDLPAGEKTVVRIKRAGHVDGAPYVLTVNVLPVAIGALLDATMLRRRPIVDALEDVLQIRIAAASEVYQAAAADAEIAHWLDLPALSPVMHVRRLLVGPARRPIQLADDYYRADKFQYSVQLRRVSDKGRSAWAEVAKKNASGRLLKI